MLDREYVRYVSDILRGIKDATQLLHDVVWIGMDDEVLKRVIMKLSRLLERCTK